MSILKYFKCIDKAESSNVLLDPEGPLSMTVPSEAIATAKEKVKDCRGPQTLTSAQKLLIGQRAAEYGTTAAMRFFAKKYLELSFKETTV